MKHDFLTDLPGNLILHLNSLFNKMLEKEKLSNSCSRSDIKMEKKDDPPQLKTSILDQLHCEGVYSDFS